MLYGHFFVIKQRVSLLFFWHTLGGGVLKWKGDGFCDDINNNEACNYDEEDCCGTLTNKRFCVNCQCISKNLIISHRGLRAI